MALEMKVSELPVGVVGLGLMGSSIVAALLNAGHPVVAIAPVQGEMDLANKRIRQLLVNIGEMGLLKADFGQCIQRLVLADDYGRLAACRLVMECVLENPSVKDAVFEKITRVVARDAVIASNTSAIPISLLQKGVRHPERFLGIHWAEPAYTTRFLEITRGKQTTASVGDWVFELAKYWGKEPTLLKKDIRGFITNRLMYAVYREALSLVEAGSVSLEDADKAFKYDMGSWITFMGVFRRLDYMGLKEASAMFRNLFKVLSNRTDVPVIMQQLADRRAKGIHDMKGLYPYTAVEANLWDQAFTAFNRDIYELAARYSESKLVTATKKRNNGIMTEKNYKNSAQLLARAKKVLAGGVSSEFRKYNHPHALFYTHGTGSHIFDVDGNDYLDFTLSQGPLILGHSHPSVLSAVNEYSEKGQLFAGQHIREIELAEKMSQLIPSAEMMRFCLDGSEAVQTAFRIARSKTRRPKFLRFEGHYHGWLDNVAFGISTPSAEALGSREEPRVYPWSTGLPAHAADDFIILPWNDLDLVKQTLAMHHASIAAIITEPVMCNNGCIMPLAGFLEGLRDLCDEYGIALIFDEVITGFRMSLGGAQAHFKVTPDLSIFAKAMGSGYPISAIVGKYEWMREMEEARVIHAGTMNSSNPTVAAALATITVLEQDPDTYQRIYRLGKKLMDGIREAAGQYGKQLLVMGPGPMFCTAFGPQAGVKDYRDTLRFDKMKLNEFISQLHDAHIRVIGRGLWYISAAHTEEEIDHAINVTSRILKEI